MKGIILAGGTGSRLAPMTRVVNKHILPVYHKPMIYYPIEVLLKNHIRDIMIVSTPDGISQIANILDPSFMCQFSFRVQYSIPSYFASKPGGILEALQCCKGYAPNESIAVILGDQIFYPIPKFEEIDSYSARIYLNLIDDVETLRELGVAKFNGPLIEEIQEKPIEPPSNQAVTGLYLFGSGIWNEIKMISNHCQSIIKEGKEWDMTYLLNQYALGKRLTFVTHTGFWRDAGTFYGIDICNLQMQLLFGASAKLKPKTPKTGFAGWNEKEKT